MDRNKSEGRHVNAVHSPRRSEDSHSVYHNDEESCSEGGVGGDSSRPCSDNSGCDGRFSEDSFSEDHVSGGYSSEDKDGIPR